jgi:hypothetical protein
VHEVREPDFENDDTTRGDAVHVKEL